MMSGDNSFRKNTMILTLGTLLNKGMQFLAIPFFSRWLSTGDYGRFDLYYTYVSLLLPIISLSIDDAVFRYCVETTDSNKQKSYLTNALAINIFNLIIGITLIMAFVNQITLVVIAFCLYLASEIFSQYLRGYLRGMKRLDLYSCAMVINTFIMIIAVTILVYYKKLGVEGILFGYAIGTWGGNIIICLYSKLHKMINVLNLSVKIIKGMLSYSLPLVPNVLSWWIMNASDRQIINWYFGDQANGIYAIAHKIPALCSVVFNMFTISWQQDATMRINDEDRNIYFNKIINEMYVILSIVCIGLFSCSFIFYHYIFDIKYSDAQLYSPIMILAAALMAISQFYGGIQIALKESKKNGFTTVLGAASNVLIHLILIKYVGLFAAAISTLVGNYIILVVRKKMLSKIFAPRYEKKNIYLIGILSYFFITAYVNQYLIFNIVNLFLACLVACICGKEILKKVLVKTQIF